LNVLSNFSEEEFNKFPLKIGPRARLQKALGEYKKKSESEIPISVVLGLNQTITDDYIAKVRRSLIELSGNNRQVPFVDHDQLQFLDELGQGASGTVWRGHLRKPGEERGKEVAIKVLILTSSEDFLDDFKKEFMVLQSFNHPNVVKLFGVCLKPNLICLVMEYCAMGSLYHVINKADMTIMWDQFFSICKQSVLGLQALHNHNPKILHRDLKSLNLLMTKDWNVKVADFGLSLETNARTDMLIETRGTTSYMPPELFHATKYSTKSDVYSLGIVFWEMLYRVINQKYLRPYGEYNYSGPNSDILIVIAVANDNLRPTIPKNAPPDLAKLVHTCIKALPDDRPEAADVFVLLERAEEDYLLNKTIWNQTIQMKTNSNA